MPTDQCLQRVPSFCAAQAHLKRFSFHLLRCRRTSIAIAGQFSPHLLEVICLRSSLTQISRELPQTNRPTGSANRIDQPPRTYSATNHNHAAVGTPTRHPGATMSRVVASVCRRNYVSIFNTAPICRSTRPDGTGQRGPFSSIFISRRVKVIDYGFCCTGR